MPQNPLLPSLHIGEQLQVGDEKSQVSDIQKGDTVLDALNLRLFIAKNTVPVTLNSIINGYEGQRIIIHGDGYTTVANTAKIKTIEGANKLLTLGRIYAFTKLKGVWHEEGANATGAVPPTDLSNYYTKAENYAKTETYSQAQVATILTTYVPWDTQKKVLLGNQQAPAYSGTIKPDVEVNHIDTNTTQIRSYGIAVNHTIKPAGAHPTNLIGAAVVGNIGTDVADAGNLNSLYGLSFGITHRGTGNITSTLYGIDINAASVTGAGSVGTLVAISGLAQSGPGTTSALYGATVQAVASGGAGSIASDMRVGTFRPTVNSGNVVLLRCINVRSPLMGGGTITELHGVYIEDHSLATVSGGTKNNITSKGANSKNVFEGTVNIAGDLETTTASKGIIMKSPNGTRYRLTVADDGTLSTTAI